MRFIGFVLLIVFLVLGSGIHARSMIDPPSLIITLGGMVFALLFAGVSMPSMVKVFFSGDTEADVVQEGIRGWKLAAVFALIMGSIGTLIGLVIMLKNMDDPAAIGPGFAIANLTSIYALITALAVCLPVYKSLERSR
jgi:flagellar motor component MotA